MLAAVLAFLAVSSSGSSSRDLFIVGATEAVIELGPGSPPGCVGVIAEVLGIGMLSSADCRGCTIALGG